MMVRTTETIEIFPTQKFYPPASTRCWKMGFDQIWSINSQQIENEASDLDVLTTWLMTTEQQMLETN